MTHIPRPLAFPAVAVPREHGNYDDVTPGSNQSDRARGLQQRCAATGGSRFVFMTILAQDALRRPAWAVEPW